MFDEAAIVREILAGYTLPLHGAHGVVHWARVRDNGLRIAAANGADAGVVALFALFHDARRENEFEDPLHGARGAALARSLQGSLLGIDDARLAVLERACRDHTSGLLTDDPTLGACWDSDRLDLSRVGITPDPRLLCTDAARELLPWADARARRGVAPEWIAREWGVALGRA